MRILAIVAALLVTGGVVTVAGSAFADSDSGSGSGDSGLLSAFSSDEGSDSGEENSEDGSSDDGSENGDDQGSGGRDDQGDQGEDGQGENGQDQGGNERRAAADENNGMTEDVGEVNADNEGAAVEAAEAEDPFPGRAEAANADRGDYVDISDVEANGNIGEGGVFSGASYAVDCGVSDHNNSDNYMAAPGKRNGAQHVHDYVGNQTTNADSDDDSLQEAADDGQTSCTNGDGSTFFWPVLRDINGASPDEGQDGGSLDGNVGSIVKPASVDLRFHGHGDREVQPMPTHLMMIMGNAKQGAQDGKNVNAKYTCSGAGNENRITAQYPICGEGEQLTRILDYPSCWDGENLDSKDFRSHIFFPDDQGNCESDQTPIPALRITLKYDQPEGRTFQIDSFPNEQHDPATDHSDYENVATEAQNEAGAECIAGRIPAAQCTNIPREGISS
ncbi:DUF1996 domain-containing protein [Actinomycetospora chibensis]|uniref:DUF1996 domain-containing protein n=1 Tax=Actinomycetospora chibensis TaxID=663606 RepID=A0ABV9RIQ4_9PSEU|nr:DUF1996 domain-containing protein [Actinomycetospora chibensis]MDD7922601.1 DUF1996 domain-containing protein [Actinomycetospora chibensis]